MSETSGQIITVLGPITPQELGITLPHEHLLLDISLPEVRGDEGYAITLENSGANRRYSSNNPNNMRLKAEDEAIVEMEQYRKNGGGALVEVSSIGLERDPEGLQRIAQASGVHVIMGSSYYVHHYHPREVAGMGERDITDAIVGEFAQGVEGTDIRPGIIGEVGLFWPHHEDEVKALRASAIAQRETGAPLMIHPGRDPRSPLEAIAVVKEAGGAPERCIMAHIDRTLFTYEDMAALANTGCTLEFDLFGQESSYYSPAPIDMPNDAKRVDHLMALMAGGYGRQLLISQDICHKNGLTKYGGDGYSHILLNVVPTMRRKGMTQEELDLLMVHNPARMLTIN